jgi:nucleoid DNA-binding protein
MAPYITKRNLWRYVNLKMNRIIHRYHVFSVISILFDEMNKDLQNGREIKIANFGSFDLKDTPPRWYHNVRLRKMMQSPGYRIIRFVLVRKIQKKILKSLKLDNE